MPVDPTGADLKRYLAEDEGGAVVMLNLLSYKEGGVSSYREYSEKIQPFLDRVGGTIVYAGNCGTSVVAPDDWDWDAVLLVRYPEPRSVQQDGRRPGVPADNATPDAGALQRGPTGHPPLDRPR